MKTIIMLLVHTLIQPNYVSGTSLGALCVLTSLIFTRNQWTKHWIILQVRETETEKLPSISCFLVSPDHGLFTVDSMILTSLDFLTLQRIRSGLWDGSAHPLSPGHVPPATSQSGHPILQINLLIPAPSWRGEQRTAMRSFIFHSI